MQCDTGQQESGEQNGERDRKQWPGAFHHTKILPSGANAR
jgi:hypothetical protein